MRSWELLIPSVFRLLRRAECFVSRRKLHFSISDLVVYLLMCFSQLGKFLCASSRR